MDIKDVAIIKEYLVNNFSQIESSRKLQGFSWKNIIIDIKAKHGLILDENNGEIREKIRKIFLFLRIKTSGKVDLSNKKEVVQLPINNHSYIDSYSKPKIEIKTEKDEFLQWKEEKERLKSQVGLHVVIGCVHLPAVNTKMFEAFIKFLEDIKPQIKGIHLIGDVLDCKSLSTHDKGQVSDTTLEEEYRKSNIYLDKIDAVLPEGIEKNYIWGNHEERYTRILKQVDHAKFGKALLSPTAGCKFIERGYTVQEDYKNAKIQLGKYLDLIHGEYVTSNATKKHLDVYKKSIMFAHTHKMGAYFDTDKAAFNIGWMGNAEDKAFSYCSRVAKEGWQNGFGVVNVDAEGFYHVQLIHYYKDRFFFGGKEYKS